MGVVLVRNEKDVWGAASVLIYHIVCFAIRRSRRKEYLERFKSMLDNGYNFISFFDLDHPDKIDFFSIVSDYLNENQFSELHYDDKEVRESLIDLIGRMKDAIQRSH